MCPPVSAPHVGDGTSYLYQLWKYELQHGPELRVCFCCFAAALMSLRESLELEEWAEAGWDGDWDGDWDWDLGEFGESSPGQGAGLGLGPSSGQGQGPPAEGGSGDGGPWALAPAPGDLDELDMSFYFVPTELSPQEAVPLAVGPEHASWIQGLPWRLEMPPVCPHWPSVLPQWEDFHRVDVSTQLALSPGEPMVLELGCARALDPAEAEASLLELQVMVMVRCFDAIYLRKMVPCRALRAAAQGWSLLLEPKELWMLRLPEAPLPHELHQWKLMVLESPSPGQKEELVSADLALLQRGFTILSCSSLADRGPEQGDSAPRPPSSTRGQESSVTKTFGHGPGETLAVAGASGLGELPGVQPLNPGPPN